MVIKHYVIGDSIISGIETEAEEQENSDVEIQWLSYTNETPKEIFKKIEKLCSKSSKKTELNISAMLWQDAIPTISVQEVESIVSYAECFMEEYPQHQLAFPECVFVPAQKDFFDKIEDINKVLADYNQRNNHSKYALYKALSTHRKGNLKVRQQKWKEYCDLEGEGREMNEKGNKNFIKYVERYHIYGFNSGKQTTSKNSGRPNNKIKSPEQADARLVINKIQKRQEVERIEKWGNMTTLDGSTKYLNVYKKYAKEKRKTKKRQRRSADKEK